MPITERVTLGMRGCAGVDAEFDRTTPVLLLKIGRYPLHAGGLGAVRSLGRVGVPVYAVTEDHYTPLARSRYLSGAFVAPTSGRESDACLLDVIGSVTRRLPEPTIVLPTDDEAAVFVAEHRHELGAAVVVPPIDGGLPRRLASKRGLHDLCDELGIPAPWAAFPQSQRDVEALAREAQFPVVLKNVDPWTRLCRPAVPNTTVVHSAEELLARARTWPDPPGVMLQEYVAPHVADDWLYHTYCDTAAQVAVAFTGVKYRSWPPRAGVTTYGRVVTNPELYALGEKLCSAIGYRGIADLDWRFDRRDGRYKLVDFNPRLGAQFRLFENDAGIDVVRALHLDLTGRPIPTGGPRDGAGFVLEHLDLAARAAYLRLPDAGAPEHAAGRVELAWFAPDDPLPFVAMALRCPGLLGPRVARGYRRARDRVALARRDRN